MRFEEVGMARPRDREILTVRQAVARNVARLRRARGWSLVQLEQVVRQDGGHISDATLSRLEQLDRRAGDASTGRRLGKLGVQEMLDLARAFGVSPLALLVPPNTALLRLSETPASARISGRRFREWLVGRRPLTQDSSDRYFAHHPGSIEQTEEWHELQALAADAAWAAQDPDIGYAEAVHLQRHIRTRLDLLLEQLELTTRRRDPEGAAAWERRTEAHLCTPRASTTTGTAGDPAG